MYSLVRRKTLYKIDSTFKQANNNKRRIFPRQKLYIGYFCFRLLISAYCSLIVRRVDTCNHFRCSQYAHIVCITVVNRSTQLGSIFYNLGDNAVLTIVSFINAETTKARGSLIEVLKHGIEISNQKLELMYTKPATTFNPELTRKYGQNIFSVMEEVWASDKERIDMVIFLNGLAIISFELKCNTAGQSYQDAIYQYRTERNPKTRLFLFKAGCLVNFSMDLEEVYMTTKLAGDATFFLPFNMGNGEGVTAGAGNPTFEDKYSVYYMWEDILTKDTILDLISKFIFVEVKEKVDDQTGKVKRTENLIFPRYHQLDVIRKILTDVRVNRTAQNYLIQHSAGSGKSNSIALDSQRTSTSALVTADSFA